jgi:hypothetical protein
MIRLDNSNYSILLTSEFKEKHNEFLSFIELLSELKSNSARELDSLSLDYIKLESIKNYNETIDANYSFDEDILTMSHKILLSKLKSKVKDGIDNKMNQLNVAKKIHQDIANKTEIKIKEIDLLHHKEIVEHISSEFNLSIIINDLKSSNYENNGNENKKKNETQNNRYDEKILTDYNNLFTKYHSKEKINNSKKGNVKLSDKDAESKLEFFKDKIDTIANIINMPYDETYDMVLNKKETFVEMFKSLPIEKQKIIHVYCFRN